MICLRDYRQAKQRHVERLSGACGVEGLRVDQRNLEREIGSVVRKVARRNLKVQQKKHGKEKTQEIAKDLVIEEKVSAKAVEKYLGPHRHRYGIQNKKSEVGIRNILFAKSGLST